MVNAWIKFSKDMVDDPRVVAAGQKLLHSYLVSRDGEKLSPGDASRFVTNALLGAVVTLWCYADRHVRDDDSLPCDVTSLDAIVGIAGFCDAMPDEWVTVSNAGTVTLPDYCAKNSLIPKRNRASKGAERQRRYRERHKDEVTRNGSVTRRHAPPLRNASPRGDKCGDRDLDQDRDQDLIQRSEARDGIASHQNGESKESNSAPPDLLALTDRCKSAYPAGTYTDANWLLAERELVRLVEEGEGADDLVAAAQSYGKQLTAIGRSGTQFVKSPEKFFGRDGHWRGPFTIPPPDPKREAELLWLQVRAAISNQDLRKNFEPTSRVAQAVQTIGGWQRLGMSDSSQLDKNIRFDFVRAFCAAPAQASAA